MKNIGKWFWLLNKRLYKKATFLLIMLLIPVLVLGYGIAAQEESGVMTIALAQDGSDPMAEQVITQLMSEPSLIRFVRCDSQEAAKKMIRDGKADAAWLFPKNMEQRVYRFVNNPSRINAFIRVVERDASVPMKLTREKLSGTVFALTSRHFYLHYIRENVPQLDHVADEELMRHYDNFQMDMDLFDIVSLDSDAESENEPNYLLAPVRGLLAVVMVLGGLAAAMYFIQDNNLGTFCLVPEKRAGIVEFICQIIAVGNLAVVALIALILGSMSASLSRELLVTPLYVLSVSLFAMNIRQLCRKLTVVGAILPLLIVVMLVICPIFFDLGALRSLQYLFPPTYYVNGAYSDRFMYLLCGYDACLLGLYYLSGKLIRKI